MWHHLCTIYIKYVVRLSSNTISCLCIFFFVNSGCLFFRSSQNCIFVVECCNEFKCFWSAYIHIYCNLPRSIAVYSAVRISVRLFGKMVCSTFWMRFMQHKWQMKRTISCPLPSSLAHFQYLSSWQVLITHIKANYLLGFRENPVVCHLKVENLEQHNTSVAVVSSVPSHFPCICTHCYFCHHCHRLFERCEIELNWKWCVMCMHMPIAS